MWDLILDTSGETNVTAIKPQLNYCLQSLMCSDHNSNTDCMPQRDNGSVSLYVLATRELQSLYKLVNNKLVNNKLLFVNVVRMLQAKDVQY